MTADQLSLTFAALADPTRRAIVTLLADGEATVNEVAARFPISVPAISRHLKVLEGAGLITRSREAQWRHNRLHTAPFDDAMDWMQARTRTWQARMDRLEAHLRVHPDDPDDSGEQGARDDRADPHQD
ncbi:ArsR/SmtB family transcription factor [Actinomycetospora sp. CA-101289]|uniref:ArsR/SmtB family transcription factor n=1 Tax=Actinomycetospora sp. CA-101289 TaxID=3239893 RepID=UPI003D961577